VFTEGSIISTNKVNAQANNPGFIIIHATYPNKAHVSWLHCEQMHLLFEDQHHTPDSTLKGNNIQNKIGLLDMVPYLTITKSSVFDEGVMDNGDNLSSIIIYVPYPGKWDACQLTTIL